MSERFPPQPGGVARSAARIVRNLAPRVEKIAVIRLCGELPPGRVEHDGAVYRVGRAPEDDESLQLLEQVVRGLVRSQGFELLHGFYAVPAGYLAAVCARMEGLPCLLSLRGNDLDRVLYRAKHLPMLQEAVRLSGAISCVSREQQARLRSLWGRDSTFIANAVDPEEFFPVPAAVEPGCLLASGEMRFKKGLTVLLDLLEQWGDRTDRRLVLLGGVRREERERLERWRRGHPRTRLELRPYDPDPARLREAYCRAALIVHPSLWEGMPNTLLEALACDRPVLATRVGGVADLIEPGRTGWLLEPHQLGELAEHVERALASSCQGGREHVLAHHRPEQEAEAFLRLYAQLLQ